jgi:hypothetical protein
METIGAAEFAFDVRGRVPRVTTPRGSRPAR